VICNYSNDATGFFPLALRAIGIGLGCWWLGRCSSMGDRGRLHERHHIRVTILYESEGRAL